MALAIDKLVNGDKVYVTSSLNGEAYTEELIVEGPVYEGLYVVQIKTSGPTITLKVKAPNGDNHYYKGMKIYTDSNGHRFFFTDYKDKDRVEFILTYTLEQEANDSSTSVTRKSNIRKKLSINDFKTE